MKFLLTGGNGMLAQKLQEILKTEGYEVTSLSKEQLNIVDKEKLESTIKEYNPNIIINCAAYTKVDMAEIEREKAFQINALAPYYLSSLSRKLNIYLVHISTDYIFSGHKKEPYHPFDIPSPINYYGLTKLYGEYYIQNSKCHYLIVRTSWLYGPSGNNFVLKLLRQCEEKSKIQVVNDQYGAPTSTYTLGKYLLKLIKKDAHGVFHISDKAGNGISWYTFAKKIVEVFERNTEIVPLSTEKAAIRPAKRPPYSTLDISATEYFLGEKLPFWEISLGDFKSQLKI